MRDAIKELKPSKLRDSRGVSKEIIKNIQNTIIPSLTKLGKLSLEANKVPICQKMVHIIGIPKGSGSDRLCDIHENILTLWFIKNYFRLSS